MILSITAIAGPTASPAARTTASTGIFASSLAQIAGAPVAGDDTDPPPPAGAKTKDDADDRQDAAADGNGLPVGSPVAPDPGPFAATPSPVTAPGPAPVSSDTGATAVAPDRGVPPPLVSAPIAALPAVANAPTAASQTPGSRPIAPVPVAVSRKDAPAMFASSSSGQAIPVPPTDDGVPATATAAVAHPQPAAPSRAKAANAPDPATITSPVDPPIVAAAVPPIPPTIAPAPATALVGGVAMAAVSLTTVSQVITRPRAGATASTPDAATGASPVGPSTVPPTTPPIFAGVVPASVATPVAVMRITSSAAVSPTQIFTQPRVGAAASTPDAATIASPVGPSIVPATPPIFAGTAPALVAVPVTATAMRTILPSEVSPPPIDAQPRVETADTPAPATIAAPAGPSTVPTNAPPILTSIGPAPAAAPAALAAMPVVSPTMISSSPIVAQPRDAADALDPATIATPVDPSIVPATTSPMAAGTVPAPVAAPDTAAIAAAAAPAPIQPVSVPTVPPAAAPVIAFAAPASIAGTAIDAPRFVPVITAPVATAPVAGTIQIDTRSAPVIALSPPTPPPAGTVATTTSAIQAFGAAMRAGLAKDPRLDPATGATATPSTAAAARTEPTLALAAAGDVQQAPLDLRRGQWPQAMIDRIETLRDAADATSSRIRVVPDALGPIEMSVRKDGDTLHVRFTADQAATRAILTEAQPRLAAIAEQRGLRLGGSTVDGGGSGAGQQQHQAAARQPTAPRPSSPSVTTMIADDDTRIA
ncbi:flagellar hook-length control protein FliK [uncultured Sphingomonas sp.]|uniref:flagellar hook-length control protein FliK n=1 Tax=uncultured Sphingomonas sp. TaxID=158754 RepID=UPI0035C9A37B